MPAGISRPRNRPKCLISLGKINFLPEWDRGKVCCDLHNEEIFRQHLEGVLSCWIVGELTFSNICGFIVQSMPQRKKAQKFFGIHHVLAFHPAVKRFAIKKPGIIRGMKELATVFEAASHSAFFADLSTTRRSVVDFGRIYFRQPDAVLELMQLMRKILFRWRKTESGKVRVFLLTHQTVFVDIRRPVYDEKKNCTAVIVKSHLDNTEKYVSTSSLAFDKVNELMYSKLAAVSSLLDKEIATLLHVKPESVKKARQSISRQEKQIDFWRHPEMMAYYQTGIVTPKLKRLWRIYSKGKN